MTSFPLKIVTPDGLLYDGNAEQIVVRTTSGDMGIQAGHINCVAPLGMGQAMILSNGQRRYGACIGGMLSVLNGQVTLVPTTFEWSDQIDLARAQASAQRAQTVLQDKSALQADVNIAEARIKRALIRQNVANQK